MNRGLIFFAIAIFLTGCRTGHDSETGIILPVIPAPLDVVMMKGSFTFKEKTKIILSEDNSDTRSAARFLADMISSFGGFPVEIIPGKKPGSKSVFMKLDTTIREMEAYRLTISPGKVIIHAGGGAGMFYAVQTIRQLLPPESENSTADSGTNLTLPACEISDRPRFSYRGMHLDVGRHLFPVAAIKRYIDMMALHKMNTFHWHLTEDQGWRIEIKKYPKLTEIGSVRKETMVGRSRKEPIPYDGKPYGGYYTQEEIKEVVAYARDRFITIIPEIEMPGHTIAALAAYPEYSCTGGPFEVRKIWGISQDIFCAGREDTFRFLEDIITEVVDLFPGTYFHIGGDEAPKLRWEKCPLCQKRMRDEKLTDEHELQSYFIVRIEKFLNSKGRRLIGWDEILEGGLAPEATVMSWRGITGGIQAAKQKHDVIMTPSDYCYLNFYQKEPEGEPLAIGGYLPLEMVYSFNPVPQELAIDEARHILGVQGCLWTEYIKTSELLEYMAYPRMFAIAETGWTSPRIKDFESFLKRLEVQKKRYDIIGINYFRGEYLDSRTRKKKNEGL